MTYLNSTCVKASRKSLCMRIEEIFKQTACLNAFGLVQRTRRYFLSRAIVSAHSRLSTRKRVVIWRGDLLSWHPEHLQYGMDSANISPRRVLIGIERVGPIESSRVESLKLLTR